MNFLIFSLLLPLFILLLEYFLEMILKSKPSFEVFFFLLFFLFFISKNMLFPFVIFLIPCSFFLDANTFLCLTEDASALSQMVADPWPPGPREAQRQAHGKDSTRDHALPPVLTGY